MKYFYFLFLAASLSFGQGKTFKPGSYEKRDGTKVSGFINFNNPGEVNRPDGMLHFKAGETAEVSDIPFSSLAGFEIGDDVVFKRFRAKMTEADGEKVKSKEVGDKDLLLAVLAEGKASLYEDMSAGSSGFFFSVPSNGLPVTQLRQPDAAELVDRMDRSQYRMQMVVHLQCQGTTSDEIMNADYRSDDLINVIRRFNTCSGSETKVYGSNKTAKSKFVLSVFGGASFGTLTTSIGEVKLSDISGVAPFLGVEGAIVFPSGKWALFARTKFEKFSGDAIGRVDLSEFTDDVSVYESKFDYFIVDIPVGLRYYATSSERSSLFFDLAAAVSMPFGDPDSRYYLENAPDDGSTKISFSPQPGIFVTFGIGFQFQGKYAVEARYDTPKGYTATPFQNEYSTLSTSFRYIF